MTPGNAASVPTSAAGLERSMKLLGTLLITLSSCTPASSLFIIVPGILLTSGSGAFLSMLLAAVAGIFLAFVYAELSSAFPLAGGEYAIVARVLGPLPGFMVMGVYLVIGVLIPAVIALGISSYLAAIDPHLPAIGTAIATIAVTTLVGILNIRINAVVTGAFLAIEMLALGVLLVLGFLHVSRPLSDLFLHPVMLRGGSLVSTPVSMIGMATAVALFAYNGYGAAVNFSEEMHEPERHVAGAILWALAITVFTELVPLTAVLMGVPDLRTFLAAPNMFGQFITARGGVTLNTLIGLGVALAIFNAIIAVLLLIARTIFSTGRDRVWPEQVSHALARVHTRFRSPWVATLVSGVLASLACLLSENLLFVLTGAGLILVYSSMCLAVIMGRRNGKTAHGHYRMPLFPVAPIAALLVMLYVVYTSWLDPVIGRPSLFATLAIMLVAALYYALVLRRRGAWVLRGP